MINQISIHKSSLNHTLERICALPLFMGISRSDMEEIMGRTRFDFQKIPIYRIICNNNEINNHLYFLLDGLVEISRKAYNNSVLFTETLEAPAIIGADILFGISRYHTHCYKAKTNTQFMIIDKKEITSNLLNYEIFRFNLLNHISMLKQKQEKMLYEPMQKDLTKRFVQYLKHNFLYPAGSKWLKCRQKDLGEELLSHEKNICKMLNSLEEKQLVKTGRSKIFIPSFQALIQSYG